MSYEEIVKKHTSLVTGGYAEMKPEARIKYHTQTTIEAVIQEIQDMVKGSIGEISPKSGLILLNRASELQKIIEAYK